MIDTLGSYCCYTKLPHTSDNTNSLLYSCEGQKSKIKIKAPAFGIPWLVALTCPSSKQEMGSSGSYHIILTPSLQLPSSTPQDLCDCT